MDSGLKKSAACIFGWTTAGVIINLVIWFLVLFGAGMSASAGYFWDVVLHAFFSVWVFVILSGFVLLLCAGIAFFLNRIWARKLYMLGTWISILSPALGLVSYVLLLSWYARVDIFNLFGGAVFGVGGSILTYSISRGFFNIGGLKDLSW